MDWPDFPKCTNIKGMMHRFATDIAKIAENHGVISEVLIREDLYNAFFVVLKTRSYISEFSFYNEDPYMSVLKHIVHPGHLENSEEFYEHCLNVVDEACANLREKEDAQTPNA